MPWRVSTIVLMTLIGIICGHFMVDMPTRVRSYKFINIKGATRNIDIQHRLQDSNYLEQFSKNSPTKELLINDDEKLFKNYYEKQSDTNEKLDFLKWENLNKNNDEDYTENSAHIIGVPSLKRLDFKSIPNMNASQLQSPIWAKMAYETVLASLPRTYYKSFVKDLIEEPLNQQRAQKRSGANPVIGCECRVKNDLMDLGQNHFPRYLLNAICQNEQLQSTFEYPTKCWRGSYCKPLEYKVKVLAFRTLPDQHISDAAVAWLPDDLRQMWKFKTVTVSAGCFCSY